MKQKRLWRNEKKFHWTCRMFSVDNIKLKSKPTTTQKFWKKKKKNAERKKKKKNIVYFNGQS